jgi:hypothetical protein
MKKFFYFVVFFLVLQSAGAQTGPTEIAGPNLLQKSKTQRTVGFVLLGAGAFTTIAGASIATNHVFTDFIERRKQVRGSGAMIAGIVMMAGSIPFFTLSKQNRRAGLTASGITIVLPLNKQVTNHRILNDVQAGMLQPFSDCGIYSYNNHDSNDMLNS